MTLLRYWLQVIVSISVIVFIFGIIWKIARWTALGQVLPVTMFPAPKNRVQALVRVIWESLSFRPMWSAGREAWLAAWGFHLVLALLLLGHLVGISQEGRQFMAWGLSVAASEEMSARMGMALGAALTLWVLYLTLRRLVIPSLRQVSNWEDYAVLVLLLGITVSGDIMRLKGGVDLGEVRMFVAELFKLRVVPVPDNLWFKVHLTLISLLLIWFPLGKLLHSCGIFFTRWLINRPSPREVMSK